jgi:hypothetical protein
LDLTDPVAVPDSELLAFLGGNALPEAHEDCAAAGLGEGHAAGDADGSLGRISVSQNPVAKATEFALRLGESGRLDVDLVDASGRRVRSLHGRRLGAGTHVLSLDLRGESGSFLASGVYYLRASLRDHTGRLIGTSRATITVVS